MEEKILLDEREVSKEELQRLLNEVKDDPKKKLKEVTPGVWKTLDKLED